MNSAPLKSDFPPPRCRDKYNRLLPLPREQATQIAQLLNNYSALQVEYNTEKILNSEALYYPLHYNGFVLGSITLQRYNFLLTEIKHLVVHPSFRKFGVGKALLAYAIPSVTTPITYATVRTDNEVSKNMFTKAGFRTVAKVVITDHQILLLVREN